MTTPPSTPQPQPPTAPPTQEPAGVPLAAKFPWQTTAIFVGIGLAILTIVVVFGLDYLNTHADDDEGDWDQMLVLFAMIVNPVTLIVGAVFGVSVQSPLAAAASDSARQNEDLARQSKQVAEKNFAAANTALHVGKMNSKIGDDARTILGALVQSIEADELDPNRQVPDLNLQYFDRPRGAPPTRTRSLVEQARSYLDATEQEFTKPEAWSSAIRDDLK